jgi:hypothetical protein
MHDVEFVREGDGHALEIALSGTYDFTNMFFTDYGDTGTLSAALDVSATTGDVTINVNGGDTPTYNTAGATVTVNNTVTVTVVVQDVEGNLLSGARVLMEADAGGDLTEGTDIVTGLTNVSGQAVNAGFNYTNPQPVKGWVRKSTDAPYYKQGIIAGTIQSTGLTTTILMIIENSAGYKNLIAIRDYTKATRLLVKELQAEMANVVTQLQQEKVERQHLQDQLVQILQRII